MMLVMHTQEISGDKSKSEAIVNDPTDQYRKSLVWLLPGHNTETHFKDTFQQLSVKYVL